MDWRQDRCCWVDKDGTEHQFVPPIGPGLTYAEVTWMNDEGYECRTHGYLLEVNQEHVMVRLDDDGVCFIPRAAVKLIASQWRRDVVPGVAKIDSSIAATKATTSAPSVIADGNE